MKKSADELASLNEKDQSFSLPQAWQDSQGSIYTKKYESLPFKDLLTTLTFK